MPTETARKTSEPRLVAVEGSMNISDVGNDAPAAVVVNPAAPPVVLAAWARGQVRLLRTLTGAHAEVNTEDAFSDAVATSLEQIETVLDSVVDSLNGLNRRRDGLEDGL